MSLSDAICNRAGNLLHLLQAALGAGMRCIITYTNSTKDQDFTGAERILEGLGDGLTLAALSLGGPIFDDRVAVVTSA
jgi:hypothetical protein